MGDDERVSNISPPFLCVVRARASVYSFGAYLCQTLISCDDLEAVLWDPSLSVNACVWSTVIGFERYGVINLPHTLRGFVACVVIFVCDMCPRSGRTVIEYVSNKSSELYKLASCWVQCMINGLST